MKSWKPLQKKRGFCPHVTPAPSGFQPKQCQAMERIFHSKKKDNLTKTPHKVSLSMGSSGEEHKASMTMGKSHTSHSTHNTWGCNWKSPLRKKNWNHPTVPIREGSNTHLRRHLITSVNIWTRGGIPDSGWRDPTGQGCLNTSWSMVLGSSVDWSFKNCHPSLEEENDQ